MPFLFLRSLVCTAPSTQGHIEAAGFIGSIYSLGQGVVVDYKRAMAAYKIGAEGGNAVCQHELGTMYVLAQGIDSPDYKQALVWLEKAANQDLPVASRNLGAMSRVGRGQQPSWRRAREHWQRAIALGDEEAVKYLLDLSDDIQQVFTPASQLFPEPSSPPPPPPPPPPPQSPSTHPTAGSSARNELTDAIVPVPIIPQRIVFKGLPSGPVVSIVGVADNMRALEEISGRRPVSPVFVVPAATPNKPKERVRTKASEEDGMAAAEERRGAAARASSETRIRLECILTIQLGIERR